MDVVKHAAPHVVRMFVWISTRSHASWFFSPAQEMDDASSSDDNPDDDDDDDNTEDEDDQFGNVGKLERRKRRARRRLIRQACPAQIKLIQQHGASILAQTNGGVK